MVLAFRGILGRLWACGEKGSWAKAGVLHTGGGSGGRDTLTLQGLWRGLKTFLAVTAGGMILASRSAGWGYC